MTLFRASGLLIALCFSALLGWINYGALSEAYGDGPPYYGRTVNMDKWSDPLPGLLMLDVPALLMLAAATALFLRRQREREADAGRVGPALLILLNVPSAAVSAGHRDRTPIMRNTWRALAAAARAFSLARCRRSGLPLLFF